MNDDPERRMCNRKKKEQRDSSFRLPHSVVAGLNRNTIFLPKDTIFSPSVQCDGCCNLALRLGRNTVPQLGHQKASLRQNDKRLFLDSGYRKAKVASRREKEENLKNKIQ